jgi:predicted GH43/DUF377 family glycosyl hydrolase
MKRYITFLFIGPFLLMMFIAQISAQTHWTKYIANPVLEPGPSGSWDDAWIGWPFVIYDGTQFIMYYTGFFEVSYEVAQVGRATSKDGINWTKYEGNPVLTVGLEGEWDDASVFSGPVIFDGSEYKMWYWGYNGMYYRTGLATSEDGIEWIKYEGNPVLDIGDSGKWDDLGVSASAVLFDESGYKMWYAGWESGSEINRVGYATSSDGITWERYAENPVLDIGDSGEWDESIWHGYVILNGNTYEMWYMGSEGSIFRTGYATSPDGINWTRYENNPILSVSPGSVILDGSLYRMWYFSYSLGNPGYAEDFSNIAHADSLALNCSYAQPTLDTLLVSAWIVNPKDQVITVKALMASDDSVFIDSTDLTDQGEGLWQGTWSVAAGERTYRVGIKTTDEESGTIHDGMMWSIKNFCTIGPIKLSSYQITSPDTIPNHSDRLSFDINLKNAGSTATASQITASIESLDTCAAVLSFDRTFGDIPSGENAKGDRPYLIQFSDACTDSIWVSFKVDIYSDNYMFWSDTFSVFVHKDPTGIAKTEPDIPREFILYQNYPNPFNPSTKIKFALPKAEDVIIEVYNTLGQKVEILLNQHMKAGQHEVELNASNLSSGVYFYKIEAGEFQDVKKMILLK